MHHTIACLLWRLLGSNPQAAGSNGGKVMPVGQTLPLQPEMPAGQLEPILSSMPAGQLSDNTSMPAGQLSDNTSMPAGQLASAPAGHLSGQHACTGSCRKAWRRRIVG